MTASPAALPELSFLVPGANENRWSDLLATLITSDPAPLSELLGVSFDRVRREVVGTGAGGERSERLDLLLLAGDKPAAAIEVKLFSQLGPRQLQRYLAAFPNVGVYHVLHLGSRPITLTGAGPWQPLRWEDVLIAYAGSTNAWVSTTAKAWLTQLADLAPRVDADTVWNDVPDEPGQLELALRTRVSWLSRQLDEWCSLEHDLTPSSGGGNWAARIWAESPDTDHLVTAEIQEGMTAYEWRPDPNVPYKDRFRGPVVLLGLRQDNVTTSADFDWELLHELFRRHVLGPDGHPHDGRAWHTTAPRPADPTDKANYLRILAAGAPRWLGKGWGMRVAKSFGSVIFGARYQLPPTITLGEIDTELRRLEPLIREMSEAISG